MHKTRVAVLRGGMSDEYAVSLATGAAVLSEIDRNIFDPIDVTITRTGEWLIEGIRRYPERILPIVDVVFIALHGAYGEDGTVQRLIERFGIPYTGSAPLPSSIAINKALTKDTLRSAGITMAPHITVSRSGSPDIDRIAARITDTFGTQYVIKPISSGSSVGTMMVKNPLLLPQAMRDALSKYDEILIEPRIIGREATCGVVERFRDTDLYALLPIEIVPPQHAEFFDATVKYDNTTEEICPGRFSRAEKDEIEAVSKRVHEILGLAQYSRSDFILSQDGIYFLEVNTLPGLTSTSLLPKAISAVGGSYSAFITHLITDALALRGCVAHS